MELNEIDQRIKILEEYKALDRDVKDLEFLLRQSDDNLVDMNLEFNTKSEGTNFSALSKLFEDEDIPKTEKIIRRNYRFSGDIIFKVISTILSDLVKEKKRIEDEIATQNIKLL